MKLRDQLDKRVEQHIDALREFIGRDGPTIVEVAEAIAGAMGVGSKLMLCGNGGSAADAQHVAAEFTNRFQLERPPLPALALTTDTSALTAIANDYSFEECFSKQVRALGREGDWILGISTSGNSPNIVRAFKVAEEIGIHTVALTGGTGGTCGQMADHHLCVRSSKITAIIQECHITALHMICQIVDETLFGATD